MSVFLLFERKFECPRAFRTDQRHVCRAADQNTTGGGTKGSQSPFNVHYDVVRAADVGSRAVERDSGVRGPGLTAVSPNTHSRGAIPSRKVRLAHCPVSGALFALILVYGGRISSKHA